MCQGCQWKTRKKSENRIYTIHWNDPEQAEQSGNQQNIDIPGAYFNPAEHAHQQQAVNHIERCLIKIDIWMMNNTPKLNSEKIEMTLLTSRHNSKTRNNINVDIVKTL